MHQVVPACVAAVLPQLLGLSAAASMLAHAAPQHMSSPDEGMAAVLPQLLELSAAASMLRMQHHST